MADVAEPGRDHLAQVASGALAAIRVPELFTHEECERIMTTLATCPMGSYDEQRVQPRVPKLGPAIYDYYGESASGELPVSYWEHATQSEETRSGLLGGEDPLPIALSRIERIWGNPVRRAAVAGRTLFAGMIREINLGMKLHFDDVIREVPGLLDEMPMCQLAFNVHLAAPRSGGEANVYQRRWRVTDELPENRDTYGYDEKIVLGDARAVVRAEVGDATFFDSRNYHIVRPNTSDDRRVTMSFFMGLTASGEITVWS
ncbi:hypothetical protein [Saccharothrix xinjiangensis]|uniref:2OG-Fe(II)-dependent halogenase WelO5 family protein n=1 Tax=Saccharothrix xinjiangensis TaxID=204798 RepID=UPI0031D1FAC9